MSLARRAASQAIGSALILALGPMSGAHLNPVITAGEACEGSLARDRPLRKVVFACVHNAGRSQMAAAFFNRIADPRRAHAISAGTKPAERVNPVVVAAMREVGIDLSDAVPQLLVDELVREAELLVTLGCGEACPYVPGLRRADWPLPDPASQELAGVREIRDAVRARVESLIATEAWSR